MLDQEVAERLTKGKEGLINKAHTYICQDLIDIMDMFTDVSLPFRKYSKHKLDHVQSIAESLDHQLYNVSGGWEKVLVETVQGAFCDHAFLAQIGALICTMYVI